MGTGPNGPGQTMCPQTSAINRGKLFLAVKVEILGKTASRVKLTSLSITISVSLSVCSAVPLPPRQTLALSSL